MNKVLAIKTERKSGVELLRIIAMFMIVAHHLSVHGVMHYQTTEQFVRWADGTLLNKITSSFMFPGGEIGVAIFFIITGYFSIYKPKGSLIKVITQTSFYGVCFLFFFLVLKILSCTGLKTTSLFPIVKTIILPGTGGGYWFVSVYVVVILLTPLINPRLSKLSRHGFLYLLFLSWLLWYSLAAFFGSTYFSIQKGIFFYCIGAYIRLYSTSKKKPSYLYFSCFLIGWIMATIIAYGIASIGIIENQTSKDRLIYQILVALETSIPVPICSACVFIMFESLGMESKKLINAIAATTFGVYLLHDFSIMRDIIWQGVFKTDTLLYDSKWFPLYALMVIIIVFLVCSLIDWIRHRLIEPMMIKTVSNVLTSVRQEIEGRGK